METFGQRLKKRRKECKVSQIDLAAQLDMHHSIIGKYERDDVNPTIEVVRRIAVILETSVGFLIGEAEQPEFFRDAGMMKRLQALHTLADSEREHVFFVLDAVLRDAKARQTYALSA